SSARCVVRQPLGEDRHRDRLRHAGGRTAVAVVLVAVVAFLAGLGHIVAALCRLRTTLAPGAACATGAAIASPAAGTDHAAATARTAIGIVAASRGQTEEPHEKQESNETCFHIPYSAPAAR